MFLVATITVGAQSRINPAQQIRWPDLVLSGTPAATFTACNANNYGQPYQNSIVTPNTHYICGTDGWELQSSSGVVPAGSGVVAAQGGALTLATPPQVVSALGLSAGSEFYGDSTTCSTGTSGTTVANVYRSPTQNGYPGLLMPVIGGDLTNYCYSGASEVDVNNFTFLHADNEGVGSPSYFGEQFINDATNVNATDAGYQNSGRYGLQAQVFFRVIPRVYKTFAQDPAVTQNGFVNDMTHQYGWGMSSTTNNSTFDCPTVVGADGHMVVWSLIKDGNGGTWTGLIDSTPMVEPVTASTTFSATGYGGTPFAGLTVNGIQLNSQYVAYIVSGLTAGTHTFHGKVTSATGAGNIVDFGGCAGFPPANINLPWEFTTGVPYQNSATGGAADSTTAAFDNIVIDVIGRLTAYGLNVKYIDVRSSLFNAAGGNEATMFANYYVDAKHLNNAGYAVEVNAPIFGYTAAMNAANPLLVSGALKNVRNGPTNQYTYNPKAPVDVSHWYNFNANNTGHGYGAVFNCASGGLNCDGIGDLPNYGLSLVMSGSPFNLINCLGLSTATSATGCTQFITAQANGALGFFGTGGGTTGAYDYFTSTSTFFGGFPGFNTTGTWMNGSGNTASGFATTVAATSGANANSNLMVIRGNYYNGTVNQPADFRLQNLIGSGATPTQTLTFTCFYSTTGCGADFSSLTAGVKLPSTSTVGSQLICQANGTNCPASGSSAFSAITSGTNNTAAMLVGSGSTLGIAGSGQIQATQLNAVQISSTVPSAGQTLTTTSPTAATWQTPTRTHQLVWEIQPATFATATALSGVFFEPLAALLQAVQIRESGPITCSSLPVISILDLGTSANTAYASASNISTNNGGTSAGVYSSGGASPLSVVIPAGHYVGVAFSNGACSTPPTFDIVATIQ